MGRSCTTSPPWWRSPSQRLPNVLTQMSRPDPTVGAQHIDREVPKPRMAKAGLPDVTLREKRRNYGQILKRASELAGFNRDQTADELSVDRSQVSRWWSGDENPQTWRYRDHPKLRIAYLKAQAEDDRQRNAEQAVTLATVITIHE